VTLLRIPLNTRDLHAISVLYTASREDLQHALFHMPTYQRTAVSELVRLLESTPNARASSHGGGEK
jgi:hypothetical protein